MNAAFDHIAHDYDQTFTHTAVGMAQRKLVWNYLEKVLFGKRRLNILELNCGTGQDAIWLAKKGHQVLATDIAKKMIEQVEIKAIRENLLDKLSFQTIDIRMIDNNLSQQKFDLVFSNFGGFNCLSKEDLAFFFQSKLPKLLKPNGRFVGVLMPKFCLWESAYFLVKLNFKDVFRRLSPNPIEANLGNGAYIKTWYYSPNDIKQLLPDKYKNAHKQPIGFFLPPSYLNTAFEKRKLALSVLEKLENWVAKVPFLAKMSDHFLIEIQQDE